MTHAETLAYYRQWRKKHPHYRRDKMREVRGTPPERYHRSGPVPGMRGRTVILGVFVNPRVGRKYYGPARLQS